MVEAQQSKMFKLTSKLELMGAVEVHTFTAPTVQIPIGI